MGGGGWAFSPYVEIILGLCPLTKILAGAHALDAGVVANMSPWGNLKKNARVNLLIHFEMHFHTMLRKSMKLCGVNHCTLISCVSIFSKISNSCTF